MATIEQGHRIGLPGRYVKDSAWQRLNRRLRQASYGTALHRLRLKGAAPSRLLAWPDDPWPGDVGQGNAIFQGRYHFAGRQAVAPNQPPWRLRPNDEEWTALLHQFVWLRHLKSAGGDTARALAQRLIRSWLDNYGHYDPFVWAPEILARRITAWLGNARFLLTDSDDEFKSALLESLRVQSRHLRLAIMDAEPGAERIAAAVGLIHAGVCLPDASNLRHFGMKTLLRELSWQVLHDGGHVSRAPSRISTLLDDLITVQLALRAADISPPDRLLRITQGMLTAMQSLRHPDGGMAIFNGGEELEPQHLDRQVAMIGGDNKALRHLSPSGYVRMQSGKQMAIVDVGTPAGGDYAAIAHAGTLSFEFSVGEDRLIVNCGHGSGRGQDWDRIGRLTAAHSTQIVDDTNSSEITEMGDLGRMPSKIVLEQGDDGSGGLYLDAVHDGYRDNFDLSHRRQLHLEADGHSLTGVDTLTGDGLTAMAGRPAVLRFHLHPQVQASLVGDSNGVLLRLGDNGDWQFRCASATVSLEESVYLGKAGEIKRSEQIVVARDIATANHVVEWRLRRI